MTNAFCGFLKMEYRWVQGIKGYQFGLIENDILCIRSGPVIRFHSLSSADDVTYFRLKTNRPVQLATHPVEPYFAVVELNKLNPRIYVYHYPDFKEVVLKGAARLDVKYLTFSHSSYLATVSAVPDFLLCLWNFQTGTLLCQTRLNGTQLSTLSFCPLNWRCLVGTDQRCLHVWEVETCSHIVVMRCRSFSLPEQSLPTGCYEYPAWTSAGVGSLTREREMDIVGRKNTGNGDADPVVEDKGVCFNPNIPQSAISGVHEDKLVEFEEYLDKTERMICESQTWANGRQVFLGSKYATLFLHLLFIKYGLLAAGRDGVVRLLNLACEPKSNKQSKSTLWSIVNCQRLYTFANMLTQDDPPQMDNSSGADSVANCDLRVTRLAVSSSFNLLAVANVNGQLSVLKLNYPASIPLEPATTGGLSLSDYSVGKHLEIVTSPDCLVGLALLGPDRQTYCITARRTGVINTWDCHQGALLGSIVLGEKCCSLVASPLIPLAVVGLQSGRLVFIDCSDPQKMRLVKTIRLYRHPLRHMQFDVTGETLVTVADDEYCIILSGLPEGPFEVQGTIAIKGCVNALSLLRTDNSETVYVAITVSEQPNGDATDLYYFQFSKAILDGQPQTQENTCRSLRDEAVQLMQLSFASPVSGACLWPAFSVEESNATPLLFVADTALNTIQTYALPSQYVERQRGNLISNGRPKTYVRNQSVLPDSPSLAQAHRRTKPPTNVNLRLASNAGARLPAAPSASPSTGTTGQSNQSKLRMNAVATASTTPAPQLSAQDTVDETSAEDGLQSARISPFKSSPILRSHQRARLRRVPGTGILLLMYADGVVEFATVSADELNIQSSYELHEANHVGIVDLEFCGDLNVIISCGQDGLLACTNLGTYADRSCHLAVTVSEATELLASNQKTQLTKLPTVESNLTWSRDSQDVSVVEAENAHNTALPPNGVEKAASGTTSRNLFFRTSTVMSLVDHSMGFNSVYNSEDEALEFGILHGVPHGPTWIEECEKQAQGVAQEAFAEAKEKLRAELAEIKGIIASLVEENEILSEMQRVGRQELELDTDEQAAILEETENAVKHTREEIELNNMGKQYTWQVLKTRCWDQMSVKGRSLVAFNSSIEVQNFPLKPRSKEEITRLQAVETRRKMQIALEMEIQNLEYSRLSRRSEQMKALQNEDDDQEDEKSSDFNLVMAGGIVHELGVDNPLSYGQMELYTREQKIYQIVIVQDTIYRLKEAFNKRFNEMYELKQSTLKSIQSKVARIRKVLAYLDQPPPSTEALTELKLQESEEPERLLQVTDDEIKVPKYYSPAELAEMEAKRLAEEEQRRLLGFDNWRERGLEEMMGGVLEVRKEEELKKDVPKPAFLVLGKPLAHWTEDDRRIYAEYERKVKELNEEREKYRKLQEAEVQKMCTVIEEKKVRFDEQMAELFSYCLKVLMAVLQEELRVWRLKWMLIVEEELIFEEKALTRVLEGCGHQAKEMATILAAAKQVVEQVREEYEIQSAEDRLLDKNFRKDFADVHGPLLDYIAKAFKRRPRRMGAALTQQQQPEGENADRLRAEERPEVLDHNPYLEASGQKKLYGDSWSTLEEGIWDLDNDPAHKSQPGMDSVIWEKLCRARRRKIAKEFEVKQTMVKITELNNFIQNRTDDLELLQNKSVHLKKQREQLISDSHRFQTDLELQLLLKQGQVEVEVNDNEMIHDFSDALFVNRNQVQELNTHIIRLGEAKVAHMIRNKESRRRFYQLEWELRKALMQYEDLQAKLKDIRTFKITREIQKYLETRDYDGLVNTQMSTLEQTINLLRSNHQENMRQKESRLKRYHIQRGEKLQRENAAAKAELHELNLSLHERKFIYDQTRCTGINDPSNSDRQKRITLKYKLNHMASEQAKAIWNLRSQLAALEERSIDMKP